VKSSEEVRLLRSKYESVLFESEESRRELGGAKHAESLKDQMERRVQEQTSSLRIKLDSREQELGQVREQYEALLLAQDGLKREFTHVRTELALVRDKYDTETRTLQGDVEQANETCRALLDKYKGISGKHSGLESEKSELLDAMSALQTVQQSLLHEREYYKNQIEVLNETLREQKTAAASSEADGSVISKHAAELETALASQREERKKLLLEVSAGEMRVQKLTQELYDARNESFGLKAKAVNADAFQKDSRTAKQQREELQLEKEQVERQLVQCRAQVATSEQEEAGLVARNGELVANLEVLTATVQEYDEQLLVIQSEIRALVEERDTVQFKHDQLLAELAVRDGAQRNTEEEQSKQLSAVRDLRKANQELSFALWSKEQELDNRTKLVHAEAQKSSGLSAARQQLTLDLGGRAEELALCQEEIKALRDEIRSMRQVLAERERETEHVRADLVAATEVGEQRRAQVEELKSLCRQVDSTREDCEVALRELVSHKERLEGELLEARHTGAEHEGQRTANEHEAAQLREVLGSLAAERDHLRLAVEDAGRGQSRATLDQQAARRKQEETASVASSARLQIEAQMQELNRKDVRIAQLNEHSEALNLELTRVSEEYALNSRELSAVLEDLGNMIKENQFVNQELAQTQEHRDQRAQDVEHLAARVSGLEEGWAATDREKQDLLSTYRAACAEIERIKMTAQEVEEERYRHRTQTAHLQEHCARLEVHVQELLREREQTMIDFEAFENQNELVSRQLETTKYQLDQALGATDLMTRDVSSAREVSHAIEGKRNDMVREIGELNHANRDLTVQLLRATAEGKALQARWDLESKRASQLEVLLSEMRVQMHRSEGERQTSTSATQSEFEVMLNEVRALREHNGGLKEQLETAHKYRERQAAEIKGLLRTMTTRLSSTTATANTTDASEATAIAQRQDRETVWSAMNGKVGSLQVSLAEQFRSVQDLQEERADLRSTLMKYEQALAKYESTRRSARGDTRPESPSSDPSD
jgi:chromosome segregation ATPase